jgi:hypothetical protein
MCRPPKREFNPIELRLSQITPTTVRGFFSAVLKRIPYALCLAPV